MILAHTSVCKPRLHWLVKFRYQLVGNCFTTNLVTVHFQAKDLSYMKINWTPLGSELHPTLEFGKYSWAFGQWFNQESTANSCSSIHVPDFIILLLMWNNCSKAQTSWTRLLARVPEAMMKIVFVFASSSLKARTKCSGYSLLNWRHIIRQRCFYLLRVATLSGFYRPYRSKGGVRFVCHNTMNCTSGREVAHFSDIHRVAQKKSLTEQCLHNWLFFFLFDAFQLSETHRGLKTFSGDFWGVSSQHIRNGVVVISIWCAARGTPTRSHSLRVSWSVTVVSGACICSHMLQGNPCLPFYMGIEQHVLRLKWWKMLLDSHYYVYDRCQTKLPS